MNTVSIAVLINLLGWVVGLALYAMLLAISLRSLRSPGAALFTRRRGLLIGSQAADDKSQARTFDALPLATAVLGLLWNAGALVTQGLSGFGPGTNSSMPLLLLGAASVAALGFLPAVVVHSATTSLRQDRQSSWARLLTITAYALSSIAAVMHFVRAFSTGDPSSKAALYILTGGFAVLMAGLFWLTRGEPNARRSVWATALAVFAVSALHLSIGESDASHERWYVELIGHHASLPLAFAILYQDYRFAFADIFLKRALSLLALLALIGGAFALYVSFFAASPVAKEAGSIRLDALSLGVLLAAWAGTALVHPWLVRAAAWFVDKVVLRRADYAELRAEVARLAHEHESLAELLDAVCLRLKPALTAHGVTWRETDLPEEAEKASQTRALPTSGDKSRSEGLEAAQMVGMQTARRAQNQPATVVVPTTDMPRYEISIGELAGGRRLLSDDIEMLEAVALTVARRIDALRVTHERCEQVQREQEIAKLATEAQLRALRAQLNPHFLFNALTTIGYLIQTSPQRALETLLRLTDLLRRVLRAGEEWTPLGEELKLIEAYLDIERARFEERLRVRFDVGWEVYELLVPSLIVQPLVENAIKHGIAPQRAGGEIHIAARLEGEPRGETLLISVRDTGAGVAPKLLAEGRRQGVGLANVEQRLRLCCGDEDAMHIESTPGGGTTVTVRVPVRRARSASTTTGVPRANSRAAQVNVINTANMPVEVVPEAAERVERAEKKAV